MISFEMLRVVLLLEGVFCLAALLYIFLHGYFLKKRDERRTTATTRVREIIAGHLARGDRELTAAEIRELRARGASNLLDVFLSTAAVVRDADHERLRDYARQLGLTTRAERLLTSRSWAKRLRSARLLTVLGTTPVSAVSRLLRDRRGEIRAQAAEWVAQNPTPASIDLLLDMLGDRATVARFTVQDSLVRSRNVTLGRLVEWLARPHSPSALAEALVVGSRIAAPELLPAALASSRHPDDSVRCSAAELLGSLGGAPASKRLTEMFADESGHVRTAAATAVGRLRVVEAAARLGQLLRDDNFTVRRAAALALRRFGNSGTLILRQYTGDPFRPAADMARHVLDLPFAGDAA